MPTLGGALYRTGGPAPLRQALSATLPKMQTRTWTQTQTQPATSQLEPFLHYFLSAPGEYNGKRWCSFQKRYISPLLYLC
jgi:hypothetical protein